MSSLRVLILKPSKYAVDGRVERYRRGFMPNATVPYLASLTPKELDGASIHTECVDEYVQTDLSYLQLLKRADTPTLLALVGVQSHQFQRGLDLAALALRNGVEHCIMGGPHPMTCDTAAFHGRGLSFSLSEAETIWTDILRDALAGGLRPSYGEGHRWQATLQPPALQPPPKSNLRRYIVPMLGIYPARGCPFTCTFCSVIKIAGRSIRSQSIDITMQSLRAAKAAGVRAIMFTSDNFNKYPEGAALLDAMIEEQINLPFFVQCDTQIARQEALIEKLARAGCFQMFVGVESFNRKTLLAAHKAQNHPQLYEAIVRQCRRAGIATHFSNIIGFPDDNPSSVDEHLDALRAMAPDAASFYILTPIPGTQQYEEFLHGGLISERNLDRFDGTNAVWNHPAISRAELREMLFRCYRGFYSTSHLARVIKTSSRKTMLHNVGLHAFSRFAAFRKMHPMSGGIGQVSLDGAADYSGLRREYFGVDLAPLPENLRLSADDEALNARAKVS